MKEIIKSVIAVGSYKLSDMQNKIHKMYLLGKLSETEADELLVLASSGVSPDAERPEILQMIQTISAEVKVLADRVKAMEDDGEPKEDADQPAWKPWDGISLDYQKGTIVTHKDKFWESVLNGQNVWEPGVPGTESMWKELESSANGIL